MKYQLGLPLWLICVNPVYGLVASPLAPCLHPGHPFHVSGVPSSHTSFLASSLSCLHARTLGLLSLRASHKSLTAEPNHEFMPPQYGGSFWNVLTFFLVPQGEAQKSPSSFPRQATLLCPWGHRSSPVPHYLIRVLYLGLSLQNRISSLLYPLSYPWDPERGWHFGERGRGSVATPPPADCRLIGNLSVKGDSGLELWQPENQCSGHVPLL